MSDRISLKDAQAEINGTLVAEICRDFGINFRDVYPEHILARGVGPEQAFIGLAIKRGHLALPAVQPNTAQCCMCGKKGLSPEEDGGTECELPDGRWVCSGDCWEDAVVPALPAVQPRVKPLEWRECRVSDEATDRAEGVGQEYSVGYDDNWGWYSYSETLGMGWANAPTRDAAKAVAQAHYNAHILSALDT